MTEVNKAQQGTIGEMNNFELRGQAAAPMYENPD